MPCFPTHTPADKLDAVELFRTRKRRHSDVEEGGGGAEEGGRGEGLSLTEYLQRKEDQFNNQSGPKKKRVCPS